MFEESQKNEATREATRKVMQPKKQEKSAKRTGRRCSKGTERPHCWVLDRELDKEQEVDDAKWHGDDGCSEEERRSTQKGAEEHITASLAS